MSNISNRDDTEQSGDGETVEEPLAPLCKKLETSDPSIKCNLCCMSLNDPIIYGDLYQIDDLVCHYFCLLLSSNLVQNGEDHEGILGFFPKDIRTEARRGSRLRCSYCRKNGATIGCHLKSCKKAFHLPCGLKHGSMHQFFDQFLSFCSQHRPSQTVEPKFLKIAEDDGDATTCVICYEKVSNQVSFDTLWAPCCKKRWFHRSCVQRQALAQGYFFKCPMCNNKEEFNAEMRKFGIYIPEMDAAWEREPQAFQDLLTTYKHCDTAICKCPDGRNFSQKTGSWRLLRCNSCGSQGTHIVCSGLKIAAASSSWRCPICVEVLTKANQRQGETTDSLRSVGPLRNSLAASCISSSGPSNSSISLRRPADILSEPETNKRRKSSPQISNLDKERSSSGSPQSKTAQEDQKYVLAGPNSDTQFSNPGPSCVCSTDEEDEIVIVDDSASDNDIEVVDEVSPKPFSIEKQFPLPQYQNKELLTKEGHKIKVHKVAAEVCAIPMNSSSVKPEHSSEGKYITRADTCSLEQVHKTEYLAECSAIKTSVSPSPKKMGSISSPSTSKDTPLKQHIHNIYQARDVDGSSTSISSSDSPGTLGIRIDNVRHSTELFSPNRAEETQITTQPPATEPPSGPHQLIPSGSHPMLLPQQTIYYLPVKTIDGQAAIQPVFLSPFHVNRQHQFQYLAPQPQLNIVDQARTSPDIVTLD